MLGYAQFVPPHIAGRCAPTSADERLTRAISGITSGACALCTHPYFKISRSVDRLGNTTRPWRMHEYRHGSRKFSYGCILKNGERIPIPSTTRFVWIWKRLNICHGREKFLTVPSNFSNKLKYNPIWNFQKWNERNFPNWRTQKNRTNHKRNPQINNKGRQNSLVSFVTSPIKNLCRFIN